MEVTKRGGEKKKSKATAVNDMQDRIKISRGISLLFKSKGTKQRGSANYRAVSPPGCLSFSEGTQFGEGEKGERVCVCVLID